MPLLHSHTHCQVAQAITQSETCQRVCLSYRTTKPNTEPITAPTQKAGFCGSKDSFVVNQTLAFQIKFCGKNPALRVAAFRQTV